MKTLAVTCSAALSMVVSAQDKRPDVAPCPAAEAAKIAWETMTADEIKGKVIALATFKDVATLMGKPSSTGNSDMMSSARYPIGNNFVLFFNGAPENCLSVYDDLRKVHSIYLYRRVLNIGIEPIWKLIKDQVPEREIRSDHVDFPPSKTDALNSETDL